MYSVRIVPLEWKQERFIDEYGRGCLTWEPCEYPLERETDIDFVVDCILKYKPTHRIIVFGQHSNHHSMVVYNSHSPKGTLYPYCKEALPIRKLIIEKINKRNDSKRVY